MRRGNLLTQAGRAFRNHSLWVEHLEDRLVPGETLTGLLLLPVGLFPVRDLAGQPVAMSENSSASAILETSSLSDCQAGSWTDSGDGGFLGESGTLSLFDRAATEGPAAGMRTRTDQPTGLDLPVPEATPLDGLAGDEWEVLPALVSGPAPKSLTAAVLPMSMAEGGADRLAAAPSSFPGSATAAEPATGTAAGDVGSVSVAASSPAASPMLQARPDAHGSRVGSPRGYSPTQIKHAYGFDQLTQNGAGVTIAIVDAYDAPNITSDLNTFSTQFGLPTTTSGSFTFTKAYAQGKQPAANGGWAQEISLDVEWAHAIAPHANILLVEAANSSFSNLFGAVDYAVNHGASVVSMSWGATDFSGESTFDSHFQKSGVTFLAAAGDRGGQVNYPSASPFVVSVGGTSLPLDSSGNLTGRETAWSNGGGGASANEVEPGYQAAKISLKGRGTPDVSYNADPNTGVAVYDSYSYFGQQGWLVFGGTSAGAPQWAGLVALADQGRVPLSSNNLNSSPLYNAATGSAYASNYRDITSGSNGHSATTSYDLATGLGSPLANNLVPYLKGSTQ